MGRIEWALNGDFSWDLTTKKGISRDIYIYTVIGDQNWDIINGNIPSGVIKHGRRLGSFSSR